MGPWSRSFVAAVVARTERPSDEVLADVRDLTVDVGVIRARVGECTVTLSADPVPPRIWAAMTRFARGRGPLEEAVAGRVQSVHLEHLMAEDWGEPLVPRARSIARACTCDEDAVCEHIVAVDLRVRGPGRRRPGRSPAVARLYRRSSGSRSSAGRAGETATGRCVERRRTP